jgi:radical SAM superfamily enzyme YgiQ (UPF0313 family)
MFMFGADADEPSTVNATSEFVREARVDSVQFMIFTPFPGTEVFRRLEAEDRLLHRKWRYYDAMHVVAKPRGFSPFDLQRITLDTYARYYSVANAFTDARETLRSAFSRWTPEDRERLGAPSMHNAFLKLVGGRIIRSWNGKNRGYMDYLKNVDEAPASQRPDLSS